jgi:MFS family permease
MDDGTPDDVADAGVDDDTSDEPDTPDWKARPDDETDTQVSYRALLVDRNLGLVTGFSFLGILGSSIAAPVLPEVATALSISDARVGLVMTAFFLPAIVFIPLAGVLADVYGRRRVVLWSLALFGVGGTAILLVDSLAAPVPLSPFEALLGLRVLQGIGLAGLTPLTVTLIGDLYDGAQASAAQGVRTSTNSIASMVSPPLAGLLAGILWSFPFALFALSFPLLLAAWMWLPETADVAGRSRASIRDEIRAYTRSITAEIDDRDLLVLLLAGFSLHLVKTGVRTYIPLFAVRSLGASAAIGGAMLSVRGAVRVVSAPASGTIVALGSTKFALLGGTALGVAGTALIPYMPTIGWLVVAVAIYSVGDAVFSTVLNDAVARRAAPEHRGGVVSGMNGLKNIGNTVAPALFGLFLAFSGFEGLFLAIAVSGLAYVVVGWALLGDLDA